MLKNYSVVVFRGRVEQMIGYKLGWMWLSCRFYNNLTRKNVISRHSETFNFNIITINNFNCQYTSRESLLESTTQWFRKCNVKAMLTSWMNFWQDQMIHDHFSAFGNNVVHMCFFIKCLSLSRFSRCIVQRQINHIEQSMRHFVIMSLLQEARCNWFQID